MKHPLKVVLVILSLYLIAQLIGIFVISFYSPQTESIQIGNETSNLTTYNLPYGLEPPEKSNPQSNLISIFISIAIAVILILVLIKVKAEIFLRIWFFIVVILAIGITINAFISPIAPYPIYISTFIALILAYFKVFKKNFIIHNSTELLIYPGIAAIFVPLLNIFAVSVLLIAISLYDVYAVWHSGFMQKMAKFQMEKVGVFGGLFLPLIGKKEKEILKKAKGKKLKKVKINVAMLGGGDIAFPIVFAGVVLHTFGFFPAFLISIGATLSLAALYYYTSEKGRFYPAMPFISAGCFLALAIVYLIQ